MIVAGQPCGLRAYDADGDRAFVAATWLRSLRDLTRLLTAEEFRRWQNPIVTHHLDTKTIVIACPVETPGTIVGWACFDGDVPLYAYVPEPFRGHGIARALVASKGTA